MMYTSNRIFRIVFFMLFVGLLVVFMIAAKQLLIPIAWASIFSFMILPLCKKLEKRLSRPTASIIGTLIFLIIASSLLFFLVYESIRIVSNENVLSGWNQQEIAGYVESMQESLGMRIIEPSDVLSGDWLKQLLGSIARQISGLGKQLVILTLIPMYLFFIVNYRGMLWRFVNSYYKGEVLENMRKAVQRSYDSIYQYLWGTGILTGVTAVMTFLILLAFGVRYSFFFAVFLAVLNLVPYIGNLLCFIVILAFVLATKPPLYALYIGISLYASNAIQENFLRPFFVGNKMEVNAAVVFTAVIIGGMIWGFSGMVLFIPLVGVVKAFVDSNPELKSFGIFFESK